MEGSVNSILYLYGFIPAHTPPPSGGVSGLDDRPVRVLELGSFAAAVSDLEAAEYGEGAMEVRLKDLAWVAERGARHETVVTWFSDHASILPARMLTVFSSASALTAEASQKKAEIEDGLARYRDLREWDLKVAYDAKSLAGNLGSFSEAAAALDREIESATPGRRYLLEKRRADVAQAEAGSVARRLAQDLLNDLRPFTERILELANPLGRNEAPVVLNAALLVQKGRGDELEEAASRAISSMRAVGVSTTLSGPWAPYRFIGETSRDIA
jgi:hypothetical protein